MDAGPLVAYLKQNEADHEWVTEQFRLCRAPLCSCDAALSEAFFLLSGTSEGTERLLALLERGLVVPSFDLRNELPPVANCIAAARKRKACGFHRGRVRYRA